MAVPPPLIDWIGFSRYRCFRDTQQVKLGRLNLVYGENNSGKSALVRLPALLADSKGPGYRGLNSSSELLRGASTRAVQWAGELPDEASRETSFGLNLRSGSFWLWSLEWQDLQRKLSLTDVSLQRPHPTDGPHEVPLGKRLDGMLPSGELTPAVTTHADELKALWERTCWLGTRRVGPSHVGLPAGRGGRLWGDGANAEAAVLGSTKLRKAVSNFYKKHTGRTVGVEARGSNADALVLEPAFQAAYTASFEESGSGLEYMFPIVTAAEVLRSEGGLLIIEEPEAHLHPRLQRALAELLVDVVTEQAGAQILVETHSETFLLAALGAAAPGGSLSPEDVALLWTASLDQDGSATVERIALDGSGRPKTPRLEQAFATMGVMRREILEKRRAHGG